MNRTDIFKALNEDYPLIRAEVSNNPIGLFETDDKPMPTVDINTPITEVVDTTNTQPTLDNSSEEIINKGE